MPAPEPEDELEILHPERTIALGGRQVTVREYGAMEWLRLLPAAEPLVATIADGLREARDTGYEAVLALIAGHADALLPLVLQAADMDMAAFEVLSADEVELLFMTWWGVDGRFFVRRAWNRVSIEIAQSQANKQLAGVRSTPSSLPTDTAAPTSPHTQSAS